MHALINSSFPINPAFRKLIEDIFDGNSDQTFVDVVKVNPFMVELEGEAMVQADHLHNIAQMILLSNEIFGIRYQNAYRIGDSDMMDCENHSYNKCSYIQFMTEMNEQQEQWCQEIIAEGNYWHDQITCVECDAKDTCEFAFDPYNTIGDCLASK